MSEGAANVVFLAVAFAGVCSAAVRVPPLRRGLRASPVVVLSCHAAGIAAFTAAAPIVYRGLGALTGVTGAGSFVSCTLVILFGAHAHLLAMAWAAEVAGRTVRRGRIAVHLAGYAAIVAAMTAAFLHARPGGPEHPLTFNAAHAGDPAVVVFLAVYMGGLAYSMLSAAHACRRGARTRNERLHKGLRSVSTASLLIFGYVACAAPALAGSAAGRPGMAGLNDLGSLSGTVGACLFAWGFSGPVVQVWWRDRGDYRRLRVLWETAVEGAGRSVALAPPGRLRERWSLLSAGAWLLIRRLADICDAERALAPWMDPALASAVAEAAGPSAAPEEVRALAGAALLLDAVRRRGRGEPPRRDAPSRPGDVAPEGERGHLVRVAGSLDHPLVLAALARRPASVPGTAVTPRPSGCRTGTAPP